jgi:hypothetical protein
MVVVLWDTRREMIMKTPIKAMLVGVGACALAAPALAYTISGTIPAGARSVAIKLHRPIPPGFVKLTLNAPPKNAGVAYALDFCIGPAANPCGLPTDRVVNVPEGQTRVEVVPSAIFSGNVFVVGQGTRVPVPYSVQVDYVP